MNSIFKILANHAQLTPDHPAIISDKLNITYSALLDYVYATVNRIERNGVTPDDTVGISLEHEVPHFILSLSLISLGINQIKLPTFNSSTANLHLAKEAGVSVTISAHNIHDYLTVPLSPINNLDKNALHCRLNGRTTNSSIYFATSGTTGMPKVFGLCDADILHQIKECSHYAPENKQRFLCASTIESNFSTKHRLLAAINGHTNIFKENKNTPILDCCLSHDVSLLCLTKYQISNLLQEPDIQMSDRLTIYLAGEIIPNTLRKEIQNKITENIIIGYGTTECGTVSLASIADFDEHQNVGHLTPHVKLEIVDQEHNKVPVETLGEIRIQAPGLRPSYLYQPDNEKYFRDGWFYPGDYGKFLDDGRLVIKGRKDNMFIMNSINIHPEEIERVLDAHDQVSAAAALPVPSSVHGQIPVCLVELKQDASITNLELREYAKQHLGLRAPRKIISINKIPRNHLGKIERTHLHKYL